MSYCHGEIRLDEWWWSGPEMRCLLCRINPMDPYTRTEKCFHSMAIRLRMPTGAT